MDTRKAIAQPTRSTAISVDVKSKPNFRILMKLSPAMTGTARKKVNSAAVVLLMPMARAPMMVEADLEVPGMMDRHWNNPIRKASLKEMSGR